jgi:preprotein translocase subunit SecY
VFDGVSSHLPLRVNQAGVIPIIFAMSIMLAPGILANLLTSVDNEVVSNLAKNVAGLFENQLFYGVLYFILVVFFTYFYTSVTFDPNSISDNMKRNGGFIPGIRPGRNTANYLRNTLSRITLTGAMFLGAVAVLPFVFRAIMDIESLVIGGTGILIVVSVVIETVKQVESQLVMRDYESFY